MKIDRYSADLDSNGLKTGSAWVDIADLKGFEAYVIRVHIERRNGRPTCTAVAVDPADEHSAPVTAPLLGRLPLSQIVSVVTKAFDFTMQPDLREELRRLRAGDETPVRDPRAVTTAKEVAEVWLHAYYRGDRAPQAAVCKELNISARTALNYIDEAQRIGLIPAEYRPRKKRRKSE